MAKKHFNYEPYIKSLAEFFNKKYKIKPYPKIKLTNRKQGDNDMFIKTGYYDPQNKEIVIFIRDRHVKDCLRSLAHEFVHHYQNLEHRLENGAYSGDKIINDDNLIKLEEEAYLKGNIVFRSLTESLQEKIVSEPTEHMRKLIKIDESQAEQIIKIK